MSAATAPARGSHPAENDDAARPGPSGPVGVPRWIWVLVAAAGAAGLAAARARGRTGGRPSRLSADQVRTARRLYEQQDMTVAQIGDVLGVSRTTIYRTLAKHAEPVARRRAKPSPTM